MRKRPALRENSSIQTIRTHFITLTESAGGLGESAWNPLVLSVGGATVTITGHALSGDDDPTQFAYLDWGTAGLGVCKDASVGAHPGSGTNRCTPSSDDNVTVGEYWNSCSIAP